VLAIVKTTAPDSKTTSLIARLRAERRIRLFDESTPLPSIDPADVDVVVAVTGESKFDLIGTPAPAGLSSVPRVIVSFFETALIRPGRSKQDWVQVRAATFDADVDKAVERILAVAGSRTRVADVAHEIPPADAAITPTSPDELVTVRARTVDLAIETALRNLGRSIDAVDVKILERPQPGLLGRLRGGAVVEVRPKGGSTTEPVAPDEPATAARPMLVFLSYASEDRARVMPIVDQLQAESISVFWDRRIPPGADPMVHLEQKLAEATCVVAVWTHTSIGSKFVRAEAQHGFDRDRLVPVRLDEVVPPFPFTGVQAADLSTWDGSAAAEGFGALVAAIRRL
jgi:hypothetical protein